MGRVLLAEALRARQTEPAEVELTLEEKLQVDVLFTRWAVAHLLEHLRKGASKPLLMRAREVMKRSRLPRAK